MSEKSLAPLLGCLRRAVGAARPGEPADRELLERYLTDRDHAAFVALLRRHGPRVFATCRRVLCHEADVEDAFQATFLVLLDKARSVRWEPSVGGWLAAVAHRVAVRTRCRAAKRSGREAQTDLPETAARGGDELLWREACAVLHEELDRLPDEFRWPLVLCYIEGLTRDEAAQSLGCSLDTVRGRLERGRARLRSRLERRGLSLSAGLLAAVGGSAFVLSSAARAGGPPAALVEATARAALAGRVSGRVAGLVYGANHVMTSKLKLLAATVTAVGLLSGVSLWLFGAQPLASAPSGPALRTAATAADEAPKGREDKKPAEPPKGEKKDAVEVSGRVLTPDDKPAAGAKLYAPKLKKENPTSPQDITMEPVGTTDAGGRFRATIPVLRPIGRTYLIAYADGFGVDFIELNDKTRADDLTLKFVKDQPITGRVVDSEGKPLAGVSVSVESIYVPANDKLDDFLTGWKKQWRDTVSTPEKRLYLPLDGLIGATTTDKDGRFKVTGAGVERIAHVAIQGSGAAKSVPYVITRAGFDPKPFNEAATNQTPAELRIRGQQPVLYGPDFTFVVVPAKVVEGVVKDAATGQPVAGVRASAIFGFGDGVRAVTDKDGKYRLEGLPQEKNYRVHFYPPDTSSYLKRSGHAEAEPGNKPVRIDVELHKGVAVTGRVVDPQTGKGVQAGVRFAPAPGNKFFEKPGFDSYKSDHTMGSTDKDGRFRLVTIPGRSLLMAQVHAREQVDGNEVCPFKMAVADPDHKELFRYDKDDGMWLFTAANNGIEFLGIEHAAKIVDLKEDGGEVNVELKLDRGKTASIKIEDADGQPLTGVLASGTAGGWPAALKLKAATATVLALDPEKPRRLVFLHPEKKLGGAAVIRGDEKEPVVVRLQPLGTVTGRFLDIDGAPLAGAEITFNHPDRIASELYRYLERTAPAVKTDKDGRFTLPGAVPGVQFYIQTRQGQTYYVGEPKIGLREAEPGKTLDLGDRKLKPQR